MNIIDCVDRDGVKIVCDEGTWYNHIVAKHQELKGCEAIVTEAITNPYQIYQDPTDINRKNLYKPFVLPKPYHQYYLRVSIEYVNRRFIGRKGYVRTAFATANKKGGDILVWQK